jgi:hypothetical protein
MSLELGYADIFVILLITIGPLKAAIVYAKLTGGQDPAFSRQVAIKTVTVATIRRSGTRPAGCGSRNAFPCVSSSRAGCPKACATARRPMS